MNVEKAREYFSSYYEGSLEQGLRESFERTMSQDAQIQAEYRAFARVLEQMEGLKAPVPEPDFDLHDAISKRLDLHFHELDRRPAGLFSGWRKLAFGGLAAVALVAAGISVFNQNSGGPAAAGLGGTTNPRTTTSKPAPATIDMNAIDLQSKQGEWTLTYKASGKELVAIATESGKIIREVELENDVLSSPVTNQSESDATVFVVKFQSAQNGVDVVLPGRDATAVEESVEGKGSLRELAKAASAFYAKPVVVIAKNSATELKWKLASGAAASSLMTALEAVGYTAEERESGVVWILPQ